MIAEEYADMLLYVTIGGVAGSVVGDVELSSPFLSHAVQIVGVFAIVRALDPLSPRILAVMPLILIWSYIPRYDKNMLDVRSCCQMLIPIAFDVDWAVIGIWNVFWTFTTTVAVSL